MVRPPYETPRQHPTRQPGRSPTHRLGHGSGLRRAARGILRGLLLVRRDRNVCWARTFSHHQQEHATRPRYQSHVGKLSDVGCWLSASRERGGQQVTGQKKHSRPQQRLKEGGAKASVGSVMHANLLLAIRLWGFEIHRGSSNWIAFVRWAHKQLEQINMFV